MVGIKTGAAFRGKKVRLGIKNGRAEGHVNRLKLIKRQAYGQAGFELLRKRVLTA